jgi:hypothetical protein
VFYIQSSALAGNAGDAAVMADVFSITQHGYVGLNLGVTAVARLHLAGSGTSGQVTTSFMMQNTSSGCFGMDVTGAAGSSYLRFQYGGGVGTGTNALNNAGQLRLEGTFAGLWSMPRITQDRSSNVASGLSWYATSHNAWQDYMAQAGIAAQGVFGNLTPPASTITGMVNSWSRRFFIEDGAGYGFVFESGTSSSTAPNIVGEIRSSDGTTRWGKTTNTGMHRYCGYGKLASPTQAAIGGTDYTFDCDAQHFFIKTGTTGTVSYTLGNLSPGQTVNIAVLTSGGARTINWYCSGATMHWNSGVKPTPTTTGSRWDIYTFLKVADSAVIGVGIMDVAGSGA